MDLENLSEKELKDLLKKVKEQEREIERAIDEDEEIRKLEEKWEKINKKIKEIDKKIEKKDKLKFITTDGKYPYFYYGYWGREHNISEEIFQAIRNAGFRTSKLTDTQIQKFAEYVLKRLENEDEELKKLKKEREKLIGEESYLSEEIWSKKEMIREKLTKIDVPRWKIERELERREEIKRMPPEKLKRKKEIEEEREKFEESFDKVYQEFKKLVKIR